MQLEPRGDASFEIIFLFSLIHRNNDPHKLRSYPDHGKIAKSPQTPGFYLTQSLHFDISTLCLSFIISKKNRTRAEPSILKVAGQKKNASQRKWKETRGIDRRREVLVYGAASLASKALLMSRPGREPSRGGSLLVRRTPPSFLFRCYPFRSAAQTFFFAFTLGNRRQSLSSTFRPYLPVVGRFSQMSPQFPGNLEAALSSCLSGFQEIASCFVPVSWSSAGVLFRHVRSRVIPRFLAFRTREPNLIFVLS